MPRSLGEALKGRSGEGPFGADGGVGPWGDALEKALGKGTLGRPLEEALGGGPWGKALGGGSCGEALGRRPLGGGLVGHFFSFTNMTCSRFSKKVALCRSLW